MSKRVLVTVSANILAAAALLTVLAGPGASAEARSAHPAVSVQADGFGWEGVPVTTPPAG